MSQAVYRVWYDIDPPLPRWYWWLVERRLTLPTRGMWMRKAEDGARQLVQECGMQPIGDPIGVAETRGRRVAVRASAFAIGPDAELHDLDDVIREFGVDLDEPGDGMA